MASIGIYALKQHSTIYGSSNINIKAACTTWKSCSFTPMLHHATHHHIAFGVNKTSTLTSMKNKLSFYHQDEQLQDTKSPHHLITCKQLFCLCWITEISIPQFHISLNIFQFLSINVVGVYFGLSFYWLNHLSCCSLSRAQCTQTQGCLPQAYLHELLLLSPPFEPPVSEGIRTSLPQLQPEHAPCYQQ